MKQKLIILFVFFFSVHTTAQNIDNEMNLYNKTFQNAYNKQDIQTLRTLLSNNAERIEIDGNNNMGIEKILGSYQHTFSKGEVVLLLNHVSSKVQNDGSIFTNGTFQYDGFSNEGNKISIRGGYLNKLIKENNQWKITYNKQFNLTKSLTYYKIDNFLLWKEEFDSLKQMRMNAGELSSEYGTFIDNPKVVYYLSEWASAEDFQAFKDNLKFSEILKPSILNEKPASFILNKSKPK